jgi:hypothetical protein
MVCVMLTGWQQLQDHDNGIFSSYMGALPYFHTEVCAYLGAAFCDKRIGCVLSIPCPLRSPDLVHFRLYSVVVPKGYGMCMCVCVCVCVCVRACVCACACACVRARAAYSSPAAVATYQDLADNVGWGAVAKMRSFKLSVGHLQDNERTAY